MFDKVEDPPNPDFVPSGEFRELPSEQLWTASINVDGMTQQQFTDLLQSISQELGFNFFGFFVTTSNQALEYHFSRYPRHKYGVPSIEQCQIAAKRLNNKLVASNATASLVENGFLNDKEKGEEFRVLLGLLEGYDKEQIVHTIPEVREKLGPQDDLVESTIYSVGNYGSYTEPAVWIKGKKADLPKVYELANEFKQERFTVEDLVERSAHVIEPPCCTTPDNLNNN